MLFVLALSAAFATDHPIADFADNIQTALDDPLVEDGDVIVLDAGTYDVPFVVSKRVTIRGKGSFLTFIQDTSDAVDTIVTVTGAGELTLRDLSVVDDLLDPLLPCSTENTGSVRGVSVSPGGSLTTKRVTFRNLFHPDSGGAVDASEATLSFENTQFVCNYTSVAPTTSGGAVHHVLGSLDIQSSSFSSNGSSRGGGLFAFDLSDLTVQDSSFVANEAIAEGGGMFGNASVVTIDRNLYCSNTAVDGGGLYLVSSQDTVLRNNVLAENQVSRYGGATYVEGSEPAEFTNNTIAGNKSPAFGGGAVLFDGALPVLYNNLFSANASGGEVTLTAINFNLGSILDVEFNLFDDGQGGLQDVIGGDLAQYTLSTTNFIADPLLTFWNNDGSCFVDAFYTSPFSPAVNAGDPSITDVGGSVSDIGAYGGPGADVVDADNDTWEDVYDCAESNDAVFPGAIEVCDEVDNNCDGEVDEGFQTDWYRDQDGDGYGDAGQLVNSCTPVLDYVQNNEDCDDTDDTLALESTWYVDEDQDGYGDSTVSLVACVSPSNYVSNDIDCDDTDDSVIGPATYYVDLDGDGYGEEAGSILACEMPLGFAPLALDCAPLDPSSSPAGIEVCDGIDNDCDQGIDEAAVDQVPFFIDADGDGYGDPQTADFACLPPSEAHVQNNGDCDDTTAEVAPGNPERCDDRDNDCDQQVDEEPIDPLTWYQDADEDGYAGTNAVEQCASPGENWYAIATDCDDQNPASFPEADEICDALDNNCDGVVDEDAVDGIKWYLDADGDGLGAGDPVVACVAPGDTYLEVAGDCDDEDPDIGPCICGGCSAASLPGPGASGIFALLGLLFLSRRRAGTAPS